jgi:glycosyltransferase involved in cell wall biosynthesis
MSPKNVVGNRPSPVPLQGTPRASGNTAKIGGKSAISSEAGPIDRPRPTPHFGGEQQSAWPQGVKYRECVRVLHVIHDFLPRHRAGSEIYAAALCSELAARHHVTVLCADYVPARAHGQLTWRLHDGLPVVEVANNWRCASFSDTYQPPVISARIRQVLDIVQPHVVHVHNLLNLSFDLPAAARERGIGVVATLHDYTLTCAAGGQRVHRSDAHICRTIDPRRCARCFTESPFYTQAAVGSVAAAVASSEALERAATALRRRAPALFRAATRAAGSARPLAVSEADIVERLAAARRVFEDVDLFVAPSQSIATEYVALGLDPAKLRISDYGFVPLRRTARRAGDSRLRIGFVGTLAWHKGPHVLIDAVRSLPETAYQLRIHGDPNVFPDYVADLRRRAAGLPVDFVGGFAGSAAAQIYGELDVVVVPSLWLENSPLVIHEAFQAGVPVIGARIGGICDLVEDGISGRLYEPESAEALTAVLQSLLADRAQLERWAARLPAVKTIADDAREWEQVYAAVTAARSAASLVPA